MSDHRAIQLKQLANLVIDAFLTRDQQFKPEFTPGTAGIMYWERPEGDKDHPLLRTDVWYRKSDYEQEATETNGEEETGTHSKK